MTDESDGQPAKVDRQTDKCGLDQRLGGLIERCKLGGSSIIPFHNSLKVE